MGGVPPNHDVKTIEAVMLELVAELHPTHLTKDALMSEVVANMRDHREVRATAAAMSGLREFGLIHPRSDNIVEPTPAALHAVVLLTER